MKSSRFFILVVLLAAFCFSSCSEEKDRIDIMGHHWIQDEQYISDTMQINVYAQHVEDVLQNEYVHYYWFEPQENKTAFLNATVSKDSFFLRFAPRPKSCSFDGATHVKQRRIMHNNVHSFEAYMTNYNNSTGPLFSYCSIEMPLSIKADKQLFGKKAGAELNDKFIVTASYPGFRVLYPSFSVMDVSNYNQTSKDYFLSGTALCQTWFDNGFYEITFEELPAEEYDKITFWLELPVTAYNVYDYFRLHPEELSTMPYYTDESFISHRLISGSITIYFDKSVEENWQLNDISYDGWGKDKID